jgi:hypothetical protein
MSDHYRSAEASTSHTAAESASPYVTAGASSTNSQGADVDALAGDGVWLSTPALKPYPPTGGHIIITNNPQHHHARTLPSNNLSAPPGFPAVSHAPAPVVGDASPETPYMVMYLPPKKGHKLFGVCCDMRKATIVVNAFSLALVLLSILSLAHMMIGHLIGHFSCTSETISFGNGGSYTFFRNEYFTHIWGFGDIGSCRKTSVVLATLYVLIRMIVEGLGIYGASTYGLWTVGVSLAGYAVDILISVKRFDGYFLLWAAFCAYPHVVLIYEMRKGIMTAQTYPSEEYSGCCG